MEYSILGIIILVLDIIAIISIVQARIESVMKLVWVILVLALPVIGMALWFIVGNKKQLI